MNVAVKIVSIIIIAIVVLAAVGYGVLRLFFPSLLGILINSLSATFTSASINRTFTSSSVNFTYPGNWVNINSSSLSVGSSSLGSLFGINSANKSASLRVLAPSSTVNSLILQFPIILTQISSGVFNLSEFQGVGVVIVGGANLPNNDFQLLSSLTNLSESVNGSEIINITMSGNSGLLLSVSNYTSAFLGNTKLTLGKMAISKYNDTLCFIFGVAVSPQTVSTVNKAFDKVLGSINCSPQQSNSYLSSSQIKQVLSDFNISTSNI